MSVYQNRRIRIQWGIRFMSASHRILFGLSVIIIGSVFSTYAISNINSAWVIGVIAVMNLSTLLLVFGVELNSIDISRQAISIDFGSDGDTEDTED